MDKRHAISIITKCAKQYQKYLQGNQIAFVYYDENNNSAYTTVRFQSNNFLHFTGMSTISGKSANDFYRASLNNRLNEKDIFFKDRYTTNLKLNVLEAIMNIDTKARMIGNYNGPHIELYTEKIVGTTTACLCLKQVKDYYIPNSVLNEDIRTIIQKPPGKIYAIFKKPINASFYTQLTYKSSNISLTSQYIPEQLINQIEPSLLNNMIP